MRATTTLVFILLALAPQGASLREAIALGQTRDDALYASFHKSYQLVASGTMDEIEIITEFRRAVLLVREKVMAGALAPREPELEKALQPYKDLVTVIVRARLHPFNTLIKEPAYDLYISAGPRAAPIPTKTLKRDPIYAHSAGASTLIGVRLEASFPRAAIDAAAQPTVVVTDEKADIVWQGRLDLSRYR